MLGLFSAGTLLSAGALLEAESQPNSACTAGTGSFRSCLTLLVAEEQVAVRARAAAQVSRLWCGGEGVFPPP